MTNGTGRAPVMNAGAWCAADFAKDTSWAYRLDDAAAAELLRLARTAHRDGATVETLSNAAASLPSLLPVMHDIRRDLASRGFALLRGVPVEAMTDAEVKIAYWAIGQFLGQGVTQNARGDFLCPVTNTGVKFGYTDGTNEENSRGYQSKADLNFHCDPTDVVSLLCLRQAMSGGRSAIVSSQSIFNVLAREFPEHLDVLMAGFPYDRKGENWPEEAAVTAPIPVFHHHGDHVSCRYARSYINGGAAKLGHPLSAGQKAALDAFDAIARRPELVFTMDFQPGDVQFLNNLSILHGRTAYEDYPDPARARFLYRLWLVLDDEPWTQETAVMRHAFARFGNLGRTPEEWRAIGRPIETA